MKKASIFIPYKKQGEGEELKLALRSIAKNCNFEYEIIIVGDCPDWLNTDEAIHFNPHISAAGEFPKAWNIIGKLKSLLEGHDMDKMVLTYDDVIFLNPVTYKNISKTIALAPLPATANELNGTASDVWKQIMQNTIKALKRNNLPSLNFETHLPRLFDAKKLSEMMSFFGFQKRPYCFPTLYFNWLKSKETPIVLSEIPDQKIKAGIYFPGDFEKYVPVLKQYFYLNWSEQYWSPELEYELLKLFPEPSIFEKDILPNVSL